MNRRFKGFFTEKAQEENHPQATLGHGTIFAYFYLKDRYDCVAAFSPNLNVYELCVRVHRCCAYRVLSIAKRNKDGGRVSRCFRLNERRRIFLQLKISSQGEPPNPSPEVAAIEDFHDRQWSPQNHRPVESSPKPTK